MRPLRRIAEPALDGLVGGALQPEVERRLDAQPALERLARAVLLDDLLLHPGREVRGGLGRGLRLRRADRVAARHRLGAVRDVLAAREVALLVHLREHDVAPALGGGRVGDRVEGARRRHHAGQQRGLVGLEHLRAALAGLAAAEVVALAEVRARRRLDPVRAVAEVDRVQILREDLRLGPLAGQVVGERGLAQLLEDRAAILRLRRVLDELLGDRRAALDGLAGRDVLPQRAPDAADVDAVVLVEALILDRDDRVLHVRRDLARRDDDPALVGERREVGPVDVGEQRVLRLLELLAVLELRQVGRDRHHHPEGGRDEREDRQAEQDQRKAQPLEPRATERWVREDQDVRAFGVAHAAIVERPLPVRSAHPAPSDNGWQPAPRTARTLALAR